MAETSVTEAIYRLGYDVGNSVQQLQAARAAAEAHIGTAGRLADQEERLTRTTERYLAQLDPRIRAEQQAANQAEHFSRLLTQGSISAERYAASLLLIERNLKAKLSATEAVERSTGRLSIGIGGLITRFTSWAFIISTVTRGLRSAAESNDELAKASKNLGDEWNRVWANAAPLLTPIISGTANILENITNIWKELSENNWAGAWQRFQEGMSVNSPEVAAILGVPARGSTPFVPNPLLFPSPGAAAPARNVSGNWIPTPGGFPASGVTVTDLAAEAAARKKIADEVQRANAVEAEMLLKNSQARQKMYDEWAASEEKRHAQFMKNLSDELKRLSQFGIEKDKLEADALEKALDYGEELAKAERDRLERFADDQARVLERQAAEVERYWKGVNDSMLAVGRDFWLEWAQSGIANIKDMFAKIKAWFAQLLWDLVIEARLRPIVLNVVGGVGGALGAAGSLLGGAGSWNGIPMGVPVTPAAGSFWSSTGFGGKFVQPGLLGAGIGSIAGMIGGNSGAGAIGGGLGGILGNYLLPGVGGLIGGALGGLAGGFFGGKPSDMRSVASFGPDMSFAVAAQSAHETSQQTLSMAQQAAQAIAQEVQALTAMGVTFTQQLSNIWLGQRDASSFQIGSGARISAGSVGDAADLAADAIAELLKNATSSDPEIAAILKAGGSAQAVAQALQALQAAKAFSTEIEHALLSIQDPLKAALALWEREAQARLDMAASLGMSVEKVLQLNAALKSQILDQYYGPTQSSLTGFIQNLQFGPGSTASPQAQYTAAFSAYDAARTAALGNATPETIAAFLGQANTFLPIARDYWASSQPYGALEQGAISTAQQLQGMISSMMSGADSTVMAITSVGAQQVEAISDVADEVRGLRSDLARTNALFQAVADRS